MPTECIPDLFGLHPPKVARWLWRRLTAAASPRTLGDGIGRRRPGIRLVERFAGCFTDHRAAELIEHEVRTLVGQRVYGIALGYEDPTDHDELRHDPWVFSPRA